MIIGDDRQKIIQVYTGESQVLLSLAPSVVVLVAPHGGHASG